MTEARPELPAVTIRYADLTIKPGHERTGTEWSVVWRVLDESGTINILPGATFARSENEAMMLADVYLAVDGDAPKFWHLLRAIQRATGTLR